MSACIGFAGRLFGHSFAGRYSRSERALNDHLSFDGRISADELKNLMTCTDVTYVHDICERCGEIRETPQRP